LKAEISGSSWESDISFHSPFQIDRSQAVCGDGVIK